MPVPVPTSIMTSCSQGLDDIEDIVKQDDLTPADRMNNRKHVKRRVIGNKNGKQTEEVHADSIIPGTQTVYIKTWGCTHNNSDSEYMAGQLGAYGYNVTTSKILAILLFVKLFGEIDYKFQKSKCLDVFEPV